MVKLEEVVDYDVKVNMEYSYNQDDSLRNMRALKEGALAHNVRGQGTKGTSESNLTDITSNPYYRPKPTVVTDDDFSDTDYLTAKCSIKLHTGIFASSKKLFPCVLTGGCFIEIDVNDAQKIVKQLDTVNRWRRMALCPHFYGVDKDGTTGWAADNVNRTNVFLSFANGINSVEDCPFVVGERINIAKIGDPSDTVVLLDSTGTTFADQLFPKISDITLVANTAATESHVLLTIEDARNPNVAGISQAIPDGEVGEDSEWVVYSASVDQKIATVDGTTGSSTGLTSYLPSVTVSNVELVLSEIHLDSQYESGMMAKMREGGAIELDFLSCTNHKQNLLSSNRNATVDLSVNFSRCKSVVIVPTDANTYNSAQMINSVGDTYLEEENAADTKNYSITPQNGIIDKLTQYQFVINEKQEPARPVNVSKINLGNSISAQSIIESEKSLNQASIPVRSFVDYNRNFVIGKCYGLNDGVMNLQGVNQQLQVLYNESTPAGVDLSPQKNKMLNAFFYHIRKLVVKGDSVRVVM
jgi:hypothetical protein